MTHLENGRIVLRPLEPGDVAAMYSAVRESIPEVSRWLPWCHAGYARADTAGFVDMSARAWADRSQFPFGIFEAATGSFVGGLSVNHIVRTNRLANIGYWVRTSAVRQGIAAAAVRLAARFAFTDLGLTRLEIACIPDNIASRGVAEKVGAKLETIARNRIVMHGRAYDAALYSLIPSDLSA